MDVNKGDVKTGSLEIQVRVDSVFGYVVGAEEGERMGTIGLRHLRRRSKTRKGQQDKR